MVDVEDLLGAEIVLRALEVSLTHNLRLESLEAVIEHIKSHFEVFVDFCVNSIFGLAFCLRFMLNMFLELLNYLSGAFEEVHESIVLTDFGFEELETDKNAEAPDVEHIVNKSPEPGFVGKVLIQVLEVPHRFVRMVQTALDRGFQDEQGLWVAEALVCVVLVGGVESHQVFVADIGQEIFLLNNLNFGKHDRSMVEKPRGFWTFSLLFVDFSLRIKLLVLLIHAGNQRFFFESLPLDAYHKLELGLQLFNDNVLVRLEIIDEVNHVLLLDE